MPTAGQKNAPRPQKTPQKNKLRCRICGKTFVPKRPDIVTCSPACSEEYHAKLRLERYHKLHPEAAYGKRVSKKDAAGKGKSATKKANGSFLDTKFDRRSDRSKIRDLLRTPENESALSKADREAVERVMALPHCERWMGGAKDWTPEQRKYAQRLEMKRISSDFSSVMESNNRKDFGPPSLDEPKKRKKADLPYKYDPFDDETESDPENPSAVNQTDESDASGDSTSDDDSGASDAAGDPFATILIQDDEIDATDEENQA